jgi:2Fe-2S ferredoxin
MIWRTKKSHSSSVKADTPDLIMMEILPEGRIVQASQGQTILEALLENRIEIDHTCGGMGTCGTCRIFVQRGLEKFDPRNDIEEEIAVDRDFAENERLSCQNRAQSGLILKKPY